MTATDVRADSIKWWPKVQIDKWSPDQVDYTRRQLRLDRDPTHEELLAVIKMPDDVTRVEV